MNAEDVSVSLKSGYNLVGNPYPCAIDWDAGWNLPTGISDTYSVWVPSAGSYGTYVKNAGVGTNDITRYIASGQGFFINNAGSATSFTIPKASKTHDYASNLKAGNVKPMVKLKITNNSNPFSDEAIVWFSSEATSKFDEKLEGQKILSMNSVSSQIYTLSSDNISLAINSMPIQSLDTVAVSFKCLADGLYHLTPTVSNVSDSVILLDFVAQKRIQLNDLPYAFNAVTTDTIKRFALIFKSTGTSTPNMQINQPNGLSISAFNGILFLNSPDAIQKGELTITNILGQVVFKKNIQFEGSMEMPLSYKGIYIISFNNGKNVYSKKIINP